MIPPWSALAAAADLTLAPPAPFIAVPVTVALDGATAQWVHPPTGGGFAFRVEPYDSDQISARARALVGDVDAALSADRYARALAASQAGEAGEAGEAARETLYLGLSDVAGAQVGRWVFVEGGRLWWHVVWRVDDGFAHGVGWVPEGRLDAWIADARAIEASLPGDRAAALLVVDGGACDGPASVDRLAAIAGSAAYADLRRAVAAQPHGAARAELAGLGSLVARADDCLRPVARDVAACELWEKDSATERSARAQRALVACVDRR